MNPIIIALDVRSASEARKMIPGVRSPGKSAADQKRIATPAEADKILDEIHAYK